MSESFQVHERPYLMVDKVEWATTPSAGGPPAEANVTFKDIGKTPAVKVRKRVVPSSGVVSNRAMYFIMFKYMKRAAVPSESRQPMNASVLAGSSSLVNSVPV
jgi:hypothetical protein